MVMETKTIAWQTGSGNIILTYQGQGDGTINVQSDANNGSARSQTITIQTTKGGLITKNVTVSQAACPFPVGDVRNFSYTGNVQSVELPAGTYKLQCWGAQGGTNNAYSSYGITANSGGKGGYSEGVLTLSQKTTVYVFVGGQGGASGNGGWNGGGGVTGTSSFNNSGELGYSKFACGGGATDIALTTSTMSYDTTTKRTNRSSASLLSRMIVAGGGCGGGGGYRAITEQGWITLGTITLSSSGSGSISGVSYNIKSGSYANGGSNRAYYITIYIKRNQIGDNVPLKLTWSKSHWAVGYGNGASGGGEWDPNNKTILFDSTTQVEYTTVSSGYSYIYLDTEDNNSWPSGTLTIEKWGDITTTDVINQIGYAGGGTSGKGVRPGSQTGSISARAGFGIGAYNDETNTRYVPGGGGAGWYGGGSGGFDSVFDAITYSGGGSGWVNIYANRGNRPSGYTGLQLDSGETKAGNTSFPSTSGGTETGHSGNGYARITRIA